VDLTDPAARAEVTRRLGDVLFTDPLGTRLVIGALEPSPDLRRG
jgi:hypothetical protein